MSDGSVSSNGGYHHDDLDPMTPPSATTIEDLAAALGALAEDTRNQYLVIGERLQALHDRGGEAEKVAKNRHEAVTTSIRAQSEATQALATTVKALGDHVETLAKGLAPKAEVEALGAQMGRQTLDSIAEGERRGAEIAATRADLATTRAELTDTKALAVVRKGAFAFGVAAGTALALEWRAALKAIVSIFGG